MRTPPEPTAAAAVHHRLSLARIAAAAERIDPAFLDSRQLACDRLSAQLGCELTLKDETANPIGCFKGRGAEHFVSFLTPQGGPLVCASAGNFGLALAHACARRTLDLTVFVSGNANTVKVAGIRARGARVVAAGADFDAAKQAAREHAALHSLRFVEDGAEREISEGAGGVAVELLAHGGCDAIVVPLGNGALLAGMARWFKAHSPQTQVIGVCAAGAPVMRDAVRGGAHGAASANTIADGIAVRVPVPEAVEDLRALVDDVVLVDDAQVLAAMRALYEHTGRMYEPSAAVGVAAITADRERFAGRRVATVLTGRNLTQQQMTQWFNSPEARS